MCYNDIVLGRSDVTGNLKKYLRIHFFPFLFCVACSLVSYISRVARINVTEQVLASESRHAARRRKNASSILDPPCTADAPDVLAPAPARWTRASAGRERKLVRRRTAGAPALAPVIASGVGRPGAVDGEGYIAPPALGLPRGAAASITDAAAALAAAPARFTCASAGRKHELISRRTAIGVAPALMFVTGSDVGRPGAVDDEGYIASPALGLPRAAAATVTDATAALAAAPARFTRASASRTHELFSRRTVVAPAFASAASSGVGWAGAVDGEGYIASPALGLPRAAAATVADAAAVLAAAPVRVLRASAGRKHDKSALTSYHSGNALFTTHPSGGGGSDVGETSRSLISKVPASRRREPSNPLHPRALCAVGGHAHMVFSPPLEKELSSSSCSPPSGPPAAASDEASADHPRVLTLMHLGASFSVGTRGDPSR